MPNPSRGHGWILKENVLEPMWTSGNILPQQMVDILDTYEDKECSNADSDMERDEFEFVEYESSDDEESNDESDNGAGIMLLYVMQINVHMATHVFCLC